MTCPMLLGCYLALFCLGHWCLKIQLCGKACPMFPGYVFWFFTLGNDARSCYPVERPALCCQAASYHFFTLRKSCPMLLGTYLAIYFLFWKWFPKLLLYGKTCPMLLGCYWEPFCFDEWCPGYACTIKPKPDLFFGKWCVRWHEPALWSIEKVK